MSAEHEHIEWVKEAIIDGDDGAITDLLTEALEAGVDPQALLSQGLMTGADIVGQKFETGEFFLPQLMLTGRALKAAMGVLEPALKAAYAGGASPQEAGTVVIATVQTDIHDIGKNIVSSMLTATGFQVHDLGVDVPVKTIIAKAQEVNADLIACSALLTTSMPVMRDLLNLLGSMGLRERFKVMVGGAPITPGFAAQIGADGTARNAMQAVQLARQLVAEQRQHAGAV